MECAALSDVIRIAAGRGRHLNVDHFPKLRLQIELQARRDADIAAIASRNLTEGHPIDGVFVIAVVTKAARNVGSLPYIIGAVRKPRT